jgi:hypothetical protein
MIYDSIFISDLHLGTKRCNIDALLEFISTIQTKKIVLVGDVIDLMCLERGSKWNRKHTLAIHKILDKRLDNCEIIYIYGNHEKDLSRYTGFINDITICREYVHIDVKENKYLCIHGDKLSKHSSGDWKQFFQHKGYEFITPLNYVLRQIFNFSLVNFLKRTIRGREYIESYERDIIEGLKVKEKLHNCKYTGAIVGHIHHLNHRMIDGYEYYCCGDWVDTCSAILEKDGNYETYTFGA